jgi:AraC family transcriptional regulator of adaptative response / DNA-3-methyladenine glycosylase II
LIASGALDDGDIENLADRLGVTSRHLRRLFTKHLGASPLAVAHTQRLHFAKRLIDQTNLPMSHIASASGFGSTRRFNDTFRKTYGRPPRELRRSGEAAIESGSALTMRLPYRKPFDWPAMLAFLAGRATPGCEQVLGDAYLRTVSINGENGIIECRPDTGSDSICLSIHGISTLALFEVAQRSREMFDLDAPTADIAEALSTDKKLRALLVQNPGIRVPGAWDGFELTVRAILGQQVSVKAATTLAGRIAERYGEPIDAPESVAGKYSELNLTRLFPTPQKLARARFNNIGLITSRAETIRRVGSTVASGELDFDSTRDPEEFCRELTSIRGIGDWTAQYVAMRVLKNPDAFPSADLALLKAFDDDAKRRISAGDLQGRAEAWRPWRAYAALLLWSSLSGSGG